MTTKNDVTGDLIQSKPATDAYRNSPFWDSVIKGNTENKMKRLAEILAGDKGEILAENKGEDTL